MANEFIINNDILEKYNGTSFDVIIPQGIRKIGKKAFSGNTYIQNIITNKELENIDDYAFENCEALSSIILEENVQRIGYACFEGCSRLSKINVPESLTEIGTGAFDIFCPISDKKTLEKIWQIQEDTEDRMMDLALPMLKLISKEFRGSGIEYEAYPVSDKINIDLTNSDFFETLELPFITDLNDERLPLALEKLKEFVAKNTI